jgi:hypothetical protein
MQTYHEFEIRKVITPDAIIGTGRDGLVEILDTGGYKRYDFKTATKLLEIMQMLNLLYEAQEMLKDAQWLVDWVENKLGK